MNAVAALRAFAKSSRARERCELCAAPLDGRHPHLFDPSARRLACACEACATCFDASTQALKWARVVPRIERLDGGLDEAAWRAAGVPVRLAYFTFAREPIALLPSPAGPIESPLPDGAWPALIAKIPAISALAPHVEGVLAWDDARAYRLSIDHAYRAIGMLRAKNRGDAAALARVLEDEIVPALENGGG